MTTSCQSLGFNVPADKATLDSVNEKVDIIVSAVNEFSAFHYPVTTTGTGEAYLITVDGTSELYDGMKLTIIPHTDATVSDATLNMNDLGAKTIYRRDGEDTSAVIENSDLWLKTGIPVTVTYSATKDAFLADGGGSGAAPVLRTVLIPLSLLTAETDGQTEFTISLDTFDPENDSIIVKSGITFLHQNADYTLSGNVITLAEGVSAGRTIGIDVIKNVVTVEEDNVPTISGSALIDGSIPFSKLEKIPATEEYVAGHNTATDAHNDIRVELQTVKTQLTNFLDIDDTTKDQVSEIIALIEDNADDIETITNGKVNVSDIVNNLTTNVANKPLSAAQGVTLKGLIDTLQSSIPSKTETWTFTYEDGTTKTKEVYIK